MSFKSNDKDTKQNIGKIFIDTLGEDSVKFGNEAGREWERRPKFSELKHCDCQYYNCLAICSMQG